MVSAQTSGMMEKHVQAVPGGRSDVLNIEDYGEKSAAADREVLYRRGRGLYLLQNLSRPLFRSFGAVR